MIDLHDNVSVVMSKYHQPKVFLCWWCLMYCTILDINCFEFLRDSVNSLYVYVSTKRTENFCIKLLLISLLIVRWWLPLMTVCSMALGLTAMKAGWCPTVCTCCSVFCWRCSLGMLRCLSVTCCWCQIQVEPDGSWRIRLKWALTVEPQRGPTLKSHNEGTWLTCHICQKKMMVMSEKLSDGIMTGV